MTLRRALAGGAVAVLALAPAACGGDDGATRGPDGELTVLDPFVPEPPLSVAALYLTIDNRTATDDALVGATVPGVEDVAVHGPAMASLDGGLPLPSGEQTVLEPGGAHVMLTGLDGAAAGDTLTVTLEFAVHEPITVVVPVAPIGATGAP